MVRGGVWRRKYGAVPGDGFAGKREDAGQEMGYMDYAAIMRVRRSCGFPDEFIGRKDVAP